jgi:hypothetical protein
MRQPRKFASGARRSTFSHQTRTVLLGLPAPAKRRPLGPRQLKLRSAAKRYSYLGLLIGLGIGLVLIALLLEEY